MGVFDFGVIEIAGLGLQTGPFDIGSKGIEAQELSTIQVLLHVLPKLGRMLAQFGNAPGALVVVPIV
jgi:hypothetical protein